MTACMSYLTENGVHLFSDRAFYRPDGTIVGFAQKVIQLHDQPIAIVGRGDATIVFDVIEQLSLRTAKRQFMGAASAMEEISRYFGEMHGLRGNCEAEFIVAACSEGAPDHALIHMHGRYTIPEYTLYHPPKPPGAKFTWLALGPQVRLPKEHYYQQDNTSFQSLGVSALARMRTVPASTQSSDKCFLVGGGVDYTVINSRGCETMHLIDWKDEVGKKIDIREGRR